MTVKRLMRCCVILLSVITFTPQAYALEYLGSKLCSSCHEQAYADWKISDHSRSMSIADTESVLGVFDGETVSFHGIGNRFFVRDNDYFVETLDLTNKIREFKISYTFGSYPLQQYLVETTDGHIQALNVAWDSRPIDAGGQRWIHLQPGEEIVPTSPFFWMNHLQNWNSRCAECHSTDVTKNYNVQGRTYNTTWSEINVGCEACHGPGKTHVQRAQSGGLSEGSGLVNAPATLSWIFPTDKSIAQPDGQKSDKHINMCGGCHSRRSIVNELSPGADYHDQYRLALLHENLYYPDGQIQDEVFVLGSFLQSKMHAKGVTCSNCHQPHSGKLLLDGNNLCAQCHLPDVFDRPQHHFHPVGSSGARCVECHMPATTYMLVDDRRDHRFGVPKPETIGTPNACNSCHKGTTVEWAAKQLQRWHGKSQSPDRYANVNSVARLNDPTSTRLLIDVIADSATPAIEKATLLTHLSTFPSRVGMQAAISYLGDSNPLVRRAAVGILQSAPIEYRWQSLKPLVDDPIKSVRNAVAVALADMQSEIPPKEIGAFNQLIEEYRDSLSSSGDMPSTQAEIANLELNLGNMQAAETAYGNALLIEPNYVPALLNLADLYRATNREPKAGELLKRALGFAPDSGAVNFSYGLSIIRLGEYERALPYLKLSTEQADSQPRYAYVYAVALDSIGSTEKALDYLKQATLKWPNQYDLLMTQILYMEKLGRTDDILKPLSALSRLAPNSPEVRQRIKRYLQ